MSKSNMKPGARQNPPPPDQTKKTVPQNDKGRRPDVAKGVDPSVSGNSRVRNPEADLQDKHIVGQD